MTTMTIHKVDLHRTVVRDPVKYDPPGIRRSVAAVTDRDAQGSHVQFIGGPTIIVPFDVPNEYADLMHGWTYQAAEGNDGAGD